MMGRASGKVRMIQELYWESCRNIRLGARVVGDFSVASMRASDSVYEELVEC